MSQWGKIYIVREWEDGILYEKTMVDLLESGTWEPPLPGARVLNTVCLNKKEVAGDEKGGRHDIHGNTEAIPEC